MDHVALTSVGKTKKGIKARSHQKLTLEIGAAQLMANALAGKECASL